MATFTMRLSDVLESVFNESIEYDDFELQYGEFSHGNVKYGRLPIIPDPEKIGLGTYPIFDESYRPILNGKIIDQYYNREICTETIDDWKLILRRKMDQIMPYYNQFYESTRLEYDPLKTIDIRTTNSGTLEGVERVNGLSSNKSETESKGRAVSQELPQTMLAGNADYATSASDSNSKSDVDSTSTQESESTTNSENNSESYTSGYQAYPADLIVRYRNAILNIDTMILADIEDCFFLLLNNGDAYTGNGWYTQW